jgi:hypothetical protein
MGAWKTYAWEKDQFRWHWRVEVKPEFRVLLTQAMAARFGIKSVNVRLTDRTWAHATVGFFADLITLPNHKNQCRLGMVCHEVAHLVNHRLYKGRGHTGTFKRALIKVMVEVKPMLPGLFGEVKRALHARAQESERQSQRAARQAQRLQEVKKTRQSPAWRLQRAQERAKRLRTKIKRLNTMLKKAERQERALARRVSQIVYSDSVPPQVDHT